MEKRILGIDYGKVRIGLAVSDPLRIIARGLPTLPNNEKVVENILIITQEYSVEIIVVGMPLTLKGEKGTIAKEVENFIQKIKNKTSLEVIEYDERFTSKIAEQTIINLGVNKKKRQQKEKIDELAAVILLQNFLDQTKHSFGC